MVKRLRDSASDQIIAVTCTSPTISAPHLAGPLPSNAFIVSHFSGANIPAHFVFAPQGPNARSCTYRCSDFELHVRRFDFRRMPSTPFLPAEVKRETHKGVAIRAAEDPLRTEREVSIFIRRSKKQQDKRAVLRNRGARKAFEAVKWCIQREDLGRPFTISQGE